MRVRTPNCVLVRVTCNRCCDVFDIVCICVWVRDTCCQLKCNMWGCRTIYYFTYTVQRAVIIPVPVSNTCQKLKTFTTKPEFGWTFWHQLVPRLWNQCRPYQRKFTLQHTQIHCERVFLCTEGRSNMCHAASKIELMRNKCIVVGPTRHCLLTHSRRQRTTMNDSPDSPCQTIRVTVYWTGSGVVHTVVQFTAHIFHARKHAHDMTISYCTQWLWICNIQLQIVVCCYWALSRHCNCWVIVSVRVRIICVQCTVHRVWWIIFTHVCRILKYVTLRFLYGHLFRSATHWATLSWSAFSDASMVRGYML
jgi:hypothetical protein